MLWFVMLWYVLIWYVTLFRCGSQTDAQNGDEKKSWETKNVQVCKILSGYAWSLFHSLKDQVNTISFASLKNHTFGSNGTEDWPQAPQFARKTPTIITRISAWKAHFMMIFRVCGWRCWKRGCKHFLDARFASTFISIRCSCWSPILTLSFTCDRSSYLNMLH